MQREGERLNAYLRTRSAGADTTSLIELSRPDSSGQVLLFAHPVGGSLLAYQPLVRRLGDHRCFGLEASARTLADGGPAESMQELARRYVESFAGRGPEVDLVCGWSFGGALAWEIACLLAARGRRPRVVLLDSTWSGGVYPRWTPGEAVRAFVDDVSRLSGGDGESAPKTRAEAAAALDMDLETFTERFEIFEHNRRLICEWEPTPGDLDVVSVRAAESAKCDWRTVTSGSVRFQDLPGDHYGLLRDDGNLAAIERAVRDEPPAAAAAVPHPDGPAAGADGAGLHASLKRLVDTPHWRDLVIRARRMDPDAITEAYRELGRRGLLTPDWPSEYGGAGTPTRRAIELFEGFSSTGLPDLVYALTVQIVGNFVLKSGSERLRRELLPRIARGEEFATVLYSEPRAGSDLAALRTRAERRGDRYVLNGVKVFSIYSDIAGSALVAARTGQDGHKYDGITLFVIDLAADGVSVELVQTVQRERMCRVRLHDVEVESWRRVGEEDRGWALLDGALAIERTGIDHVVRAARWLKALYATTAPSERLRRLEGQVECATTLARAATEVFLRADVRATDTAVAKLYTSETCQQVGHEVLRRWSALATAPGADDLVHEELFSALTESPGLTLSAGTSEMMLSTLSADLKEECSRRCREILHRFGGDLVDTVVEVLEPEGARIKAEPLFAPSAERREALAKTLTDLGFDLVERPEEEGGLGLGLTVGCGISLGMGYLGYENAYTPHHPAADGGAQTPHGPCTERACRLRHAAYVLGLGIGLFRTAWEHAVTREQFGRRLVDHDSLMFPLIRGYAELTALGARLHELAEQARDVDEDAVRRFELVEQDALVRVVRSAMQVLGAQGITEWSVASRFYMKCAQNMGLLDHEGRVADG
ncbi:acyl-CoA dehydrogenase family protein [Streptomyces sp. NPDC018057]|uniref:acyl-CoA dehydrogenase family protein n=1 Tax=unclassified Streptomyces TaxID=2593676 RepID=UPI0037B22585